MGLWRMLGIIKDYGSGELRELPQRRILSTN